MGQHRNRSFLKPIQERRLLEIFEKNPLYSKNLNQESDSRELFDWSQELLKRCKDLEAKDIERIIQLRELRHHNTNLIKLNGKLKKRTIELEDTQDNVVVMRHSCFLNIFLKWVKTKI